MAARFVDRKHAPMECGACGEITLRYVDVTPDAPFIETWECDCGHIRCFHVPAKVAVVSQGFGDKIEQHYHCSACGEELDLGELETQFHMASQLWDEEDIARELEENDYRYNYEGDG